MRRKTRRRFLAEAAGAAAGTFVWTGVCVGVGPKLLTGTRTALAAAAGPSLRFPAEERERAVAFSKQWIDAAVAIGSPSVRTNIPQAKDSKPDVARTAESLKRVAEYGAAKNVVVNLENDNPVSEDPFFLVKVIMRGRRG